MIRYIDLSGSTAVALITTAAKIVHPSLMLA